VHGPEHFSTTAVCVLVSFAGNCVWSASARLISAQRRRAHTKAAEMAREHDRTAMVALSVLLAAGFAGWLLFFNLSASDAQTAAQTAVAVSQDGSQIHPDPAALAAAQQPAEAGQNAAAEPLGHLRISRQSFRRGGLGSKALVTFTLRNDNDYAIKDPEILCTFRSRDGHYSTERRRTINDTVNMKSRKTFPGKLIGFVNIKASRAKCSLLAASRG
jgi:hypothetical protein